MVRRLTTAPAESFPKLVGSDAELEGLYRWFGSEAFGAQEVVAAHFDATRERAATVRDIRVLHDTTDFAFKGDREDIGVLEKGTRGFLAHMALAVRADESREPLGALGLHTYVQSDTGNRRKLTPAQIAKLTRQTARKDKASHHWESLAVEVALALPPEVDAIHVMDQDADDYVVFATLAQHGIRFVIRGRRDRLLHQKGRNIESMLGDASQCIFRRIRLEHRLKTKQGARYRAREERDAQLNIRWTEVTICRPCGAQCEAAEAHLTVVQVFEPCDRR
jgi:hypothetical protein